MGAMAGVGTITDISPSVRWWTCSDSVNLLLGSRASVCTGAPGSIATESTNGPS